MPDLWIWNADKLARQRQAAEEGHLSPALVALREEADDALAFAPVSVVDKDIVPPSGDKHDYMSVGPYWWPDPDTPDGLPYIRRDGEVNPDRHQYDNAKLAPMCERVEALALAAYVFQSEMYAQHATKLLRVWFLNAETKMNPHLEFGQGIPGRCDGRGIGIIDTAGTFTRLVDALGVLAESDAWTAEDDAGLKAWMRDYLTWLLESEKGQDEANTTNNHAVYFDMQAMALALYTEQTDVAKHIAEAVPQRRIQTQIEPDGEQPHELARTRSRSYSLMNTRGFVQLALLARHVDVDLWAYESDEGRSIPKAVAWFIPYIRNEKEWSWEQISDFDNAAYVTLYRQVNGCFPDPVYDAILAELPTNDAARILVTGA